MNELSGWVIAIDAFDFNDPEPLESIRATESVPHELVPIIESIDAGHRRPNKRAAAKIKIPARERMAIAMAASSVIGLIELFKSGENLDGEGKAVDVAADRRGQEPIELLRYLEAKARSVVETTAAEHGVSTETVENLLRDLRRKIQNWPNI